jgi:hypothetical protein
MSIDRSRTIRGSLPLTQPSPESWIAPSGESDDPKEAGQLVQRIRMQWGEATTEFASS